MNSAEIGLEKAITSIGSFRFVQSHVFDDRDFGVQYKYKDQPGSASSITISIYDLGLIDLPASVSSSLFQEHWDECILQICRTREASLADLHEQFPTLNYQRESSAGPIEYYMTAFQDSSHQFGVLLVAPFAGNFIKIRATFDLRNFSEDHLIEMTELLEAHLVACCEFMAQSKSQVELP